jgi:HD superfamily phosphodiesterase
MGGSDLVEWARGIAEERLASLGQRWSHVEGVAARAQEVAQALDVAGDTLLGSAWLHDIGYAPGLVVSGFHPLDGARFLRRERTDDEVVRLVAHHSYAIVEAGLRGLRAQLLAEFEPPNHRLADLLCYCDMTTGPDGHAVTVDDRLAEIRRRYGGTHVLTRFIDRAGRDLVATVHRVEGELVGA